MARDWLPPESPKSSPWWVLASLAAHVALVALVVMAMRRTFPGEPIIIVLDGGGATHGVVEMDWEAVTAGRQDGRRDRAVTGGHGRSQAVEPPVVAPAESDRRVEEAVVAVGPPSGAERGEGPPGAAGGRDVGPPREEERPGARRLGARFGDGRLWVRPWDAIAAAVAGVGRDSLDAAANAALLDSVIEARVTAFLLALPPDSFAIPRQPTWVTEINGQKWGLDGSWIYLGGLKLPSAILALIPLPQGNYDAAKRAADLQRVREDIMQAARRAESAEQFRKFVNETRARRDAEREAKKNQGVKPDSIRT
jgi:hypothetical protein